ncbi:MAG TPA: hypothetical protein VGO62_13280 [Myxococcota bacterium]|jgi:hypothetical protein
MKNAQLPLLAASFFLLSLAACGPGAAADDGADADSSGLHRGDQAEQAKPAPAQQLRAEGFDRSSICRTVCANPCSACAMLCGGVGTNPNGLNDPGRGGDDGSDDGSDGNGDDRGEGNGGGSSSGSGSNGGGSTGGSSGGGSGSSGSSGGSGSAGGGVSNPGGGGGFGP